MITLRKFACAEIEGPAQLTLRTRRAESSGVPAGSSVEIVHPKDVSEQEKHDEDGHQIDCH
jgi:ABC-type uncharacterized transport system involved in gliding motility auxiliary subunit